MSLEDFGLRLPAPANTRGPFKVGEIVERRSFKRDDLKANYGKIVAIERDYVRAIVVHWDDGSEQMCDPRDIRRFKL